MVALRGKAGEVVPLLFASPGTAGTFKCTAVRATIGADGTATAKFGC